MRSRIVFITLTSVLAAVAGCSSSSATSGDGGVDNARKLGALSDSEAGAFCDEIAAIEGGYSKTKTISCSDDAGATLSVDLTFNIGANQADCKARFKSQLPPGCANVTVGDVLTCTSDTYSQTCSSPDTGPASCTAFYACAT